MLFFPRQKPPLETWLALTRPYFIAFNPETGEEVEDTSILDNEGFLFIFPSLPDALEDLALALSVVAPVELYGDTLSAGLWRIGRRGVRLAGFQGYGIVPDNMKGMLAFWDCLNNICDTAGSQLGTTPGVTGLRLAQRLSPLMFRAPGDHIQDWSQYSFSAGARHSKPGSYSDSWLYDIHSAYPFAMEGQLPFDRWSIGQRDPPFFIARVLFDYKSDLEFSPMWSRSLDNRVYHPIEAKGVTAVINSVDIATMQRHGRLSIRKMSDVLGFHLLPLLEPVQNYLAKCQDVFPQFRRQVKIIRNSIYGKLCQRPINERYILKRIDDIPEAIATGQLYRQYNGFEFGLFRYIVKSKPFRYTPVASAITAAVRSMLYDNLDTHSIAVRTDSILSDSPRPELEQAATDGAWALKDRGPSIVFGNEGYMINDRQHLDGVQYVESRLDQLLAHSTDNERFGFDNNFTRAKEWSLEIGQHETVKQVGSRIEIYHSPLAEVHRALYSPKFREIKTAAQN